MQRIEERVLIQQVFPAPEPMLYMEVTRHDPDTPLLCCYPVVLLALVERQKVLGVGQREVLGVGGVVVDRESEIAPMDYVDGRIELCGADNYVGYAPAKYTNGELRQAAADQYNWHRGDRPPVDFTTIEVQQWVANGLCVRPGGGSAT